MPKLTKNFVDALDLPEAGQVFVWDDDLKGFGIRLTPTTKSYIVQRRVDGKTRRVTIGQHGPWKPAQARDAARGKLFSMSKGIDPSIEKKRKKALSVSLEAISEAYIKDRKKLKSSTVAEIRKHINGIFSDWKDKPAGSITREMALQRFREATERSPAQANQAFRILRALLNYAAAAYREGEKTILSSNPVQAISDSKLWNQIDARKSRIPTDKIGHVWNLIRTTRAVPATAGARTAADIVAFLLLTGARWSEAATLTWDRVNVSDGWWFLPDTTTKNKNPVTFPLSKQALEIIESRPHENDFVFNTHSKTGHIQDARGMLRNVTKITGCRIRPHDLRRTFRAVAGECGIELYKTKLLMNHKLNQDVTIHSYTETSDLRYLSAEVQKIADWITEQAKIREDLEGREDLEDLEDLEAKKSP